PLPTSPLSAARPKGRGRARLSPSLALLLVSLPCAAGAGEGWGGVLSAGRSEKHPLPTSPLSAARPKGRGRAGLSPSLTRLLVSLPCAAGAGGGLGRGGCCRVRQKAPPPTVPIVRYAAKGEGQSALVSLPRAAACLDPLRRRRRGRAGEGCFLPGAPKSTPSQPPPCPLRGQRGGAERACLPPLRGCLSPSLAPQAQGRGGEGGFLPGAPKSTPSQPPPCPLRGQRGGAERACLPPLRGCLSPSLAPQAQG